MRGTPFIESRKLTFCVPLVLGNDHGICFSLKSRPATVDDLKESICAAPRYE
jgi:hypothetical protein